MPRSKRVVVNVQTVNWLMFAANAVVTYTNPSVEAVAVDPTATSIPLTFVHQDGDPRLADVARAEVVNGINAPSRHLPLVGRSGGLTGIEPLTS